MSITVEKYLDNLIASRSKLPIENQVITYFEIIEAAKKFNITFTSLINILSRKNVVFLPIISDELTINIDELIGKPKSYSSAFIAASNISDYLNVVSLNNIVTKKNMKFQFKVILFNGSFLIFSTLSFTYLFIKVNNFFLNFSLILISFYFLKNTFHQLFLMLELIKSYISERKVIKNGMY